MQVEDEKAHHNILGIVQTALLPDKARGIFWHSCEIPKAIPWKYHARVVESGLLRNIKILISPKDKNERRFEVALINWNPEYSVNVEEIDLQHKTLIEMINGLDDAIREGKAKDITIMTIVKMTTYVTKHFSTEEKYFDRFNYPEAMLHKQKHNDFVMKVKEFENKFINGNAIPSTDVMNYLSEWVKKHVLETDKKYSSFFNEHGLK